MRNLSRDQVLKLAKSRKCPRCDFDKTFGTALCHTCRQKLPQNMRPGLVAIPETEYTIASRAIRAAANYFNVHFQSIRHFGGGKKR